MRNRNTHSITFKKHLTKCTKVFHAYTEIQLKYGESLDTNNDIVDIKSNVLLSDFQLGTSYTSDIVCTKKDGKLMVRECVYRKNLLKPSVIRLLDASHDYWISKGVDDWGIVLDA